MLRFFITAQIVSVDKAGCPRADAGGRTMGKLSGKVAIVTGSGRGVLQAAAVEAKGRPGAYVTREGVMKRANMVDVEHFRTILRYLEEQGWIADADADYGVFMVTGAGIVDAIG
jgi:predicted transcriptional regulator